MRFFQAGTGRALVLLHGLLGYSFNFRRVIPILAKGHTVFAPDMPGAGYSDCRADLDCRLRSTALRLLQFLDRVGINEADFIASSYGGTAALMLASLAPRRVRRLVLVAPANPWSTIGRKRLRLLANPTIAWLFPTLARAARPIYSCFLRRMWGDRSRMTREILAGYVLPLARPGVFEHAVRMVRTWQADMRELASALKTLGERPVLLVWGSADGVVDPRSADSLAACFPNAQVEIIAGAGHLPYEEAPEEFCRIVEAFLADRDGKGAPEVDAGSNLTRSLADGRLLNKSGAHEVIP